MEAPEKKSGAGPSVRVPRRRRRKSRRDAGEADVEPAASNAPAGSPLRALILTLVPFVACFFGAGRETWSQGLAVLLMGAVLMVVTPRRRISSGGVAVLLLVVLTPLASLLPASWLGGVAEWRSQLVNEWSLPLGDRVSPQPIVTLEAWALLLCCVLWFLGCMTQGLVETERRVAMRGVMIAGACLALLSLVEFWGRLEIPWWPRNEKSWGAGFGPFANRNHVASLCAITCVIAAAVGYEAFRRGSKWWVAALPCFLLAITAIFANTSRAGLLLFFVGMFLWLGLCAMRRGVFKYAAVSLSVVAAAVTVLLISNGNLAQKLKSGAAWENLSSDYRVLLVGEALNITKHQPLAGIGLGNFSAIFPQVTTMQQVRVRFLHPESDVLWVMIEGGLLTLLPLIALVIWSFRLTGPWRSHGESRGHSDRRLRRSAGVAASLALLHSLVDVPLHGVAYVMIASLLIALAVKPEALPPLSGALGRWGFRLVGLALVGAGAVWIGVSRDRVDLPIASAAHQWHLQALAKLKAGQPGQALKLVDKALEVTPLEYGLHHLRGQIRLNLGQSHGAALRDFGLARAIEPNVANFCYWEGSYWLAYEPILATVPWREWVRRSRGAAGNLWGGFRQMILDAEPYEELLPTLRQMAVTPSMKLVFLMAAKPGAEWQKCLDQLLAEDPNLQTLDDEQRRQLLMTWTFHVMSN